MYDFLKTNVYIYYCKAGLRSSLISAGPPSVCVLSQEPLGPRLIRDPVSSFSFVRPASHSMWEFNEAIALAASIPRF